MNISLRFRLPQGQLPSDSEQLTDLWKAAKLLEPLGFPLGEWYPPADTPEHSMLNPAFDDDGPSPAAPAVFRAGEQQDEFPGLRSFGVWNGKEGPGGAALESSLSVLPGNPVCSFELQSKGVSALTHYDGMLSFVKGLLDIWAPASIEVGPYKYFSMQQAFPNKPGAGWMLYLPLEITARQLPEARALVPVMNGRKQTGTIVVSVANEAFSADNPEHVKAANAIEVRLADQGLLPQYKDL